MLEDRTGGFNYGSGTVELQCPDAQRGRAGRRHSGCTGCAAGSTTRPARGATARPTRTRPRSTRSPRRRSARCSRPRTPRARPSEVLGTSDGTPGQAFRLRYAPVLPPAGESARGPASPSGDWEALGAARERSSTRGLATATSRSTSSRGEVELGPAIRADRRRLVAVRRGAAEGRVAADDAATATAAAARATSPPDTLTMLRSPIPGVASVTNPLAGARRRRRRDARVRAPARGDGDPHPLPRGHRRGLRVPRRRGVPARRARGLHAAARTAARCRCSILPRVDPADRQLRSTSSPPTTQLLREVGEYLDERRLVGTTRPAAARAAFRGLLGRRSTSRPRRWPTCSASRRTSPTRSTRT